MGLELDTFRTKAFFEVAQTKSFSQAAKNLGITQSALSQRIAKLEDELEVTLLIRNSKGLRVTTSGGELLRFCHAQKGLEEELLSNLTSKQINQLKGVIRIAGYSSVMRSLIMPVLAEFSRANPNIQLEILSREISELPALLYSGEVDFLVYNSLLEKNDLKAVQIGYEENVHIESANFSERKRVYLDHDRDDSTTYDYFREQGKKDKLTRSFFDDVYGIIDGVKLGFGRAVVSKHLIQKQKDIKILSSKKKVKNPIVLHYFRRSYYPKLHSKVIETLSREVPKLLSL